MGQGFSKYWAKDFQNIGPRIFKIFGARLFKILGQACKFNHYLSLIAWWIHFCFLVPGLQVILYPCLWPLVVPLSTGIENNQVMKDRM